MHTSSSSEHHDVENNTQPRPASLRCLAAHPVTQWDTCSAFFAATLPLLRCKDLRTNLSRRLPEPIPAGSRSTGDRFVPARGRGRDIAGPGPEPRDLFFRGQVLEFPVLTAVGVVVGGGRVAEAEVLVVVAAGEVAEAGAEELLTAEATAPAT